MNHYNAWLKLPVELHSKIFDSLALRDLVTASHVSTFWRAVALNHQAYSRDIALYDVSAADIDLFLARLAVGGSKAITLRIILPQLAFPIRRLCSLVLPAVAANLFRTERLEINIDIVQERDIYYALRLYPAPRLHTLDLAFTRCGARLSDTMPRELFARTAPNLRTVRLGNVLLRAGRYPLVFSAITALRYSSAEADSLSFPTAVFSLSPSLADLVIHARALSVFPIPITPLSNSALQSVEVLAAQGSFDILESIECASTVSITVPLFDGPSARLMLRHLSGRLEARVYPMGGAICVEYRAVDTGTTRGFVASRGAELPARFIDDLAARTHVFHSTAAAAGLMPAFRVLPVCTRFVFSISDGEQLEPPQRPLSAPELQRIDITSEIVARLPVENLVAFLNAAFVPLSRAVKVTLHGVSLEGDSAEIPRERFILSPGLVAVVPVL